MRIVFMGTPDYAVSSLEALAEAGYEIAGVFTQPDRPRGRGGRVEAPPAKRAAQRLRVPVFQPARLRTDGIGDLRRLRPDLVVTAAFGQILSEEALAIPPLGTVNVHASLLPRYRGSAPIAWCIMKGETRTGVTTMMTDKGIDTGDILLQKAVDILPYETAGELTPRLARLGAALLIDTLSAIRRGDCPRRPQDEARMSYYPMLRKEMGEVDWRKPALEIVNLIHGLNPWPCAGTDSPLGRLKLLSPGRRRGRRQARQPDPRGQQARPGGPGGGGRGADQGFQAPGERPWRRRTTCAGTPCRRVQRWAPRRGQQDERSAERRKGPYGVRPRGEAREGRPSAGPPQRRRIRTALAYPTGGPPSGRGGAARFPARAGHREPPGKGRGQGPLFPGLRLRKRPPRRLPSAATPGRRP